MYFLEIISFDPRHDGFFDTSNARPRRDIFDTIARLEGCLAVVGGYELEDKRRAYVITAWRSVEAYQRISTARHVLAILTGALTASNPGPTGNNPTGTPSTLPRVSILHIRLPSTANPHRALHAPLTEIVFIEQRKDMLFSQWSGRVGACVGQLETALHGIAGAYPPLLCGEVAQTPGTYLMLVGWDCIEAHTQAVQQPSMRRHVLEILKTAHTRTVHIALHNLAADAFDAAEFEGKMHTAM